MRAVFEIGNSLREARLRRELDFAERGARHEDPRQVPARARGRALRAAARAHLRQGLPALLRRVPRPRRPALRRRVQLALRHRRGGRADPRRGASRPQSAASAERRESSVVLLALAAIGLVTALVIAAWRFGGPDDAAVHGLHSTPAVTTPAAAADAARDGPARAARDARRLVPDRQVAAARSGSGALPGHARARPAAALRRQGALDPPRVARERAREAEREPREARRRRSRRRASSSTAKKIFAADAS